MMKHMGRLVLLGLGLLVSGCANMSTLHTARLVPENKTRVVMGGGAMIIPVGSSVASLLRSGNLTLPMGDGQARRAFGKRIELGVKYSILTQVDVDFKFNLFDSRWAAMSLGAGLGYVDFGSTSSVLASTASSGILRLYPAAYFDFYFAPWLGLYLNGKYTFNYLSADMSSAFVDGLYHQFSGGAGLRIGPEVFGLLAEFTVIYTMAGSGTASPWLAYQPHGGLYFTF